MSDIFLSTIYQIKLYTKRHGNGVICIVLRYMKEGSH